MAERGIGTLNSEISERLDDAANATRHSQARHIVPQIVEAEVIDPGALLRLVPGGRALLDAFACEGKAPARMLTAGRFEGRHGIRIERYTPAVARLGRAVIEPSSTSRTPG